MRGRIEKGRVLPKATMSEKSAAKSNHEREEHCQKRPVQEDCEEEGTVCKKTVKKGALCARRLRRGGHRVRKDCEEEATMCEKAVKERAHVRGDCEEEDIMCEKTCTRRLRRKGHLVREDMCEKTAKKRAEREDCEKRSRPKAVVCGRLQRRGRMCEETEKRLK